jgi:hypothetical protein
LLGCGIITGVPSNGIGSALMVIEIILHAILDNIGDDVYVLIDINQF